MFFLDHRRLRVLLGILTHLQRLRTHTNPCICHRLTPAMGMRMETREEAISGHPDQTVPVFPLSLTDAQTAPNSVQMQCRLRLGLFCLS